MWISLRYRGSWLDTKYTVWSRTPEDYPWVTAIACTWTLTGARRVVKRYLANTKQSEDYSPNDRNHVVWKDEVNNDTHQ